jgi:hypothetical protein
MRKDLVRIFTAVAMIAAAITVALLTGCVTTPVQVRPGQTNLVEMVHTNWNSVTNYTTNLVQVAAAVTNGSVVIPPVFQPTVLERVEYTKSVTTNTATVVTPPVYYNEVKLLPIVGDVITTVAGAAGGPGGTAVGGVVVGLVGGAVGIFNEFRKRRAQRANGVLVQNVETVRNAAAQLPGYTQAVDDQLMANIKGLQVVSGVHDVVAKLVEEHTDATQIQPHPSAEDLEAAAHGRIPIGPNWTKYETDIVAMLAAYAKGNGQPAANI